MEEPTQEVIEKLKKQDARGLVSEFQQKKLEATAGVNWDKFYKRNGNRFFKDRHWTTREFEELIGSIDQKNLLEVGCGVGNFFYPLLEEGLQLQVNACDVSKNAIEFVKQHSLYDPSRINAFVCDITKENLHEHIEKNSVDIVSLVFVLSAILPDHFNFIVRSVWDIMKPGGVLLFRDYGNNDMAMVRFGPGSKLGNRLYVRQDGTRAYYFTKEEVTDIFSTAGFTTVENDYILRRTVNKKEKIDCQRIFVQGKFVKPQ